MQQVDLDITRLVRATGQVYRAAAILSANFVLPLKLPRLKLLEAEIASVGLIAFLGLGVVLLLSPATLATLILSLGLALWVLVILARAIRSEWRLQRLGQQCPELASMLYFESEQKRTAFTSPVTPTRVSRQFEFAGLALVGIGVAELGVSHVVVPLLRALRVDPGVTGLLSVGSFALCFVLLPLGLMLLRHARRLSMATVADVRRSDPRRPVLYLRSFGDDVAPIRRRFGLLGLLLPFVPEHVTLEEAVVDAMWSQGPVIAIGRPGESLSPLGAARVYLGDEEWQNQIEGWLAEATAIVCVLGSTSGLDWEFAQIRTRELLTRVVAVDPPRERTTVAAARNTFDKHFDIVEAEVVGDYTFPICSVWLGERQVSFRASRRDEATYGLALRIGMSITGALTATFPNTVQRGLADFRRGFGIIRAALSDRAFVLFGACAALLCAATFIGPAFAPDLYSIDPQWQGTPLAIGSSGHLLGTDEVGRDELARLLVGGRTSLIVAFLTTLVQIPLGAFAGLAVYALRRSRMTLWLAVGFDFLAKAFLTFPLLLLVLLAMAILASWSNKAVLSASTFACIAGALAAPHVQRWVCEALRRAHSGQGNGYTPGVFVAHGMRVMASMLLLESTVSFLGWGVQPPDTSWGAMLGNAQPAMTTAPWLVIVPGACIFMTAALLHALSARVARIGEVIWAGIVPERDGDAASA
jgi:peptide/nickel transport system permease protein